MVKEKSGSKFLKFIIVLTSSILLLCFVSYGLCFIMSFVNYEKNKAYCEKNNINQAVIENQSSLQELKYGFGNIEANGCGAVSVYNILFLEGLNPNFEDIISRFDKFGLNVFGILGTNPFTIKNVLIDNGFDVQMEYNSSKFGQRAKESDYAIYTYFSFKGGHYQLMYDYDDQTETFHFLDPNYHKTMEDELESTKDYFVKIMYLINKK